jgi:CRISPR system Cascade subunit CasB
MTEAAVQLTETKKPAQRKSVLFVDYIIRRCMHDNGVSAALRRADNPSMEYQSWEVLADFRIDIENESNRLPYASIAAAIARAKAARNGAKKIGQAIARCYEDGNTSDQARAKLRRLLACDSLSEACRLLRPLFALMDSRGSVDLDYASLLDDLLWFGHEDSRLRIKARWAQDFYGKTVEHSAILVDGKPTVGGDNA